MVWWGLSAVVIMAVIMAVGRWIQVGRFQRNAKPGDHCIIYISNDKFKAVIIETYEDIVYVSCMDNVYTRYRSDIYPV